MTYNRTVPTAPCPSCGNPVAPAAASCPACGQPFRAAPDGIASVVPYRNVCALVGYYLGVFSLIPCLALALGPAALICGILGVKAVGRNPSAKGTVHAWVAIILGGLTTLANYGLILFVMLSKK